MKFFKLALFAIAIIPMATFAGVNLKNGNFYIAYTDLVVPGGGNDLKLTRTCNSKSTKIGWFGVCWGSDFETNLKVAADGSVIINEHGAGATTRFTPKESIDAKAAAEKIVTAMRKKSSVSGKAATDLVARLSKNADLRHAYARKYDVKASIAKGTVLYANTRGLQELHKTDEGYQRKFNDGKVEYFNEEGKFVKLKDKNGYSIKLTYDKSGRVKTIADSQAKQIFLDWYPDGLLKSASAATKKEPKSSNYKYKGLDLVESADVQGNVYKYTYDSNHNMTKIGYSDGRTVEIDYTKKTQLAKKVKDKNGVVTEYSYGSNPKNREHHYWTTVSKKGLSGKTIKNRYEYELKTRPDGSVYPYRVLTRINDIETETIYSECCSSPLKIRRGKQVTTFDYNSDGLLTKKASTNGDFVKLDYHKKFKKISRVVNKSGWTNFEYDKKGNLSKATNSGGKSVLLIYDRKGRINKMIDFDKKTKKKRTLSFKYNALGRPVEIAMSKVGKINVAYDNYGVIKKVESKAGQKMALQVTQAFQSLLTIVKPAGVNLNL
jgi:YD repeat-containing protein